MLIRNYGLFWRSRDVHWGHAGHLKGAASSTATPVDFREQQGVYVLYDEAFQLVYVGQAGAGEEQRLFARLKQHRRDQLSERWSRFSWYGINPVNKSGGLRVEKYAANVPISGVLDHLEAILITSAEPRHNRQGGRFGEKVTQYFQFRDGDKLGPTSDQMIRDIHTWTSTKA